MKTILLTLFILPAVVWSQTNIAIGKFRNESNVFSLDRWEKNIPASLKSEFSGVPEIVLVERENMEAIIREQVLALGGFTDSSGAEAGLLLGVDYFIDGTIFKNGSTYLITANLIRVETGQTINEQVRSNDPDYLDQMVSLLANNLRFHLLADRDYQDKISIRKYPVLAVGVSSLILAGATAALFTFSQDNLKKYEDTTQLNKVDEYYSRANNSNKAVIALGTATAAGLATTIILWLAEMKNEPIRAKTMDDRKVSTQFIFNAGKEVRLGFKISF